MVFTVKTTQKTEMIDITGQVRAHIEKAANAAGIQNGYCLIFIPHTTAAVTINESADPSVRTDIQAALERLVPEDMPYRHLEGNSPAHIRSTLVGASEWLMVENARPVLGTWQGVFFCEFDGPRTRKVHLSLMGGPS
ncbi:MAG: YjbQ family protein [Deltaproteobacteria bacterium]|nr:YjbQ family protein [Deltaproteobacteria bacterium]MBW2041234.1 YjbQ family protein [Deltaproteobacteria bacterium]MBW2133242.1 YjbQ family protein [Deltaproteobacteria bacterium]